MSTTLPEPHGPENDESDSLTAVETTTAEEVVRDPTDLYVKLIRDSPEVCSNCHHRIRARAHGETDTLVRSEEFRGDYRESNTLGTGDDELGPLRRGGDGTIGYDAEDRDPAPGDNTEYYGAITQYYARTFCGNCGRPGGRARDDTPSKREMLDSVDALVDRLNEAGIPVNPDVLQYVIGHLKSKEDSDGGETEMWRAAVALAAKNARPRDCLRCSEHEF